MPNPTHHTEVSRTRQVMRHYLKAQLISFPFLCFALLVSIFGLASMWQVDTNGYLQSGWRDTSSAMWTLWLVFHLGQLGVFLYGFHLFFSKNQEDKQISRLFFFVVGVNAILVYLGGWFMMLDFSPEAKRSAAERLEARAEWQAEIAAFYVHLNQLPDDYQPQSLGAYLLTFPESEAFISYLELSNNSTGAGSLRLSLLPLSLNVSENEVFTYFKAVANPGDTHQISHLSRALYIRDIEGFNLWISGEVEESYHSVDNLYANIMHFEAAYVDEVVRRYTYLGLEDSIAREAIEGTLYRLEHVGEIPGLSEDELDFLASYQEFYFGILARIGGDISEAQDYSDSYQKYMGLNWEDLAPYSIIVNYLIDDLVAPTN